MHANIKRFAIACMSCLICVSAALAQAADFTYQGKLVENSLPANGNYDFEFRLYDALASGTLLSTRTRLAVAVTNGIFTVQLDFPLVMFDGTDRYLEIAVRVAGSVGGYQQLLPRQPMTSAPYALRSLNATNADQATNATNATSATTATTAQNASRLGGVDAGQYVLTTDSRMTDARNPLPNSVNYVQNTTAQQTSSNFNISGSGTAGGTLSANAINATTQYNIGGNRILSNAGTANLFAGVAAGGANTTGGNNAFFGVSSGGANTTGSQNSFFGSDAGLQNTTGNRNSIFGRNAGRLNTTGNDSAFFGYNAGTSSTANNNSFFGSDAGSLNTAGFNNSFFGRNAGQVNTTGDGNSFFGNGAGVSNTTSNANSFFGNFAGSSTTGGSNTFIGNAAGNSNTTGNNNTVIGAGADVGFNNLSFATAIGAGAVASSYSTIVLGRNDGSDSVQVFGIMTVGRGFFADRISINQLGSGGSINLCGIPDVFVQIATCSSSLRYKTSIQPFIGGLDVVRRLSPITFNWKTGGLRDVGFAAEDVEKIEPLLVTYNDKGEIEGVKYGQLTTVLVNAVNEQQKQIIGQQALIEEQQQQLKSLRKLVCLVHPQAELCKQR